MDLSLFGMRYADSAFFARTGQRATRDSCFRPAGSSRIGQCARVEGRMCLRVCRCPERALCGEMPTDGLARFVDSITAGGNWRQTLFRVKISVNRIRRKRKTDRNFAVTRTRIGQQPVKRTTYETQNDLCACRIDFKQYSNYGTGENQTDGWP